MPPSSALTDKIKRAKGLYTRFTGHAAKNDVTTIDVPDNDVYTVIGRVDDIAYTTTRDGEREHYRHRFHPKSRPLITASHDGKEIRLLGGAYGFTDRGIVDTDESGNPIE